MQLRGEISTPAARQAKANALAEQILHDLLQKHGAPVAHSTQTVAGPIAAQHAAPAATQPRPAQPVHTPALMGAADTEPSPLLRQQRPSSPSPLRIQSQVTPAHLDRHSARVGGFNENENWAPRQGKAVQRHLCSSDSEQVVGIPSAKLSGHTDLHAAPIAQHGARLSSSGANVAEVFGAPIVAAGCSDAANTGTDSDADAAVPALQARQHAFAAADQGSSGGLARFHPSVQRSPLTARSNFTELAVRGAGELQGSVAMLADGAAQRAAQHASQICDATTYKAAQPCDFTDTQTSITLGDVAAGSPPQQVAERAHSQLSWSNGAHDVQKNPAHNRPVSRAVHSERSDRGCVSVLDKGLVCSAAGSHPGMLDGSHCSLGSKANVQLATQHPDPAQPGSVPGSSEGIAKASSGAAAAALQSASDQTLAPPAQHTEVRPRADQDARHLEHGSCNKKSVSAEGGSPAQPAAHVNQSIAAEQQIAADDAEQPDNESGGQAGRSAGLHKQAGMACAPAQHAAQLAPRKRSAILKDDQEQQGVSEIACLTYTMYNHISCILCLSCFVQVWSVHRHNAQTLHALCV